MTSGNLHIGLGVFFGFNEAVVVSCADKHTRRVRGWVALLSSLTIVCFLAALHEPVQSQRQKILSICSDYSSEDRGLMQAELHWLQ